jgi:TetR/AcrR family transcriptional regulator
MARPARVSPDRILSAAAVEFAARGYAGARVDRIARRARVNKAMLYYHFGSKRGLYRELLRSTFADAAERLRRVAASGDEPAVMIDRAIAAVADLAREKSFFPAVMLREVVEGGAHLDREALAALSAVPTAFGEIVERGVAAGAFRPVHPLAAYFSMIAPIVLFMAAAPIRQELSDARLLNLAALQPDAFVTHIKDSMRRYSCWRSPEPQRAGSRRLPIACACRARSKRPTCTWPRRWAAAFWISRSWKAAASQPAPSSRVWTLLTRNSRSHVRGRTAIRRMPSSDS